ncbi:polysaccharide deacetylase family protein [Autumnicola psychrophila]|uniref:Polysaccharide deacetylase family protein n=1 Tax=Autumnicola psychrophila TaxID=3075592 RepID=A0ABU3DS56_9FLAO|nr:polysaccharide deacetylase family protein [Zunongwangia sp. F225]MDT0686555.1 polysaccharide deacetylase family protein [Zunongwangia sp. F225]
MEQNGFFVISLDFELLWGIFDKVDYKRKNVYFENTRFVIPKILDLFKEYNIHCTWATVGMLFNFNWEQWNYNIPKTIPEYSNRSLSAYKYGKSINSAETEFYCFAKEIIQKINATPNQEVGTHTYSHYYCLEQGQDLESFESDLKKAIELAKEMNIELKSLVFPRNQFNSDYLKVCKKLGIENVRSNPDNWYWRDPQNNSLKTKVFRTGDAYIGINDKSYSPSSIKKEDKKPLAQKASRLLRPYSENKILNDLKLRRIKSEITTAAKNDEIYHLWWHPHNFGKNPEGNLHDLKVILEHFRSCSQNYNMSSLNMMEINSKLFSAE